MSRLGSTAMVAAIALVAGCDAIVQLGPERIFAGGGEVETDHDVCTQHGQGVTWARQFGDASYQVASSVTVGGGAVYFAGNFAGAVDFGGGPLISAGKEDYFLAAFDTNGNHRWSKRFGDTDDQTKTLVRVRASPDGGVLFFGEVIGTIEFDTGASHTASGYPDGFVARYDASGQLLWRHVITSPGPDAVTDAAFDATSGAVAVTARFGGPILDFAFEPVMHQGNDDILLAKLSDADGQAIWNLPLGGPPSEKALAVAVDAEGRIAMGGWTDGPLDFGDGLRSSNEAPDAFVAVYGPNQEHQWSEIYAGPGHQAVERMAVHPATGDWLIAGGLSLNGSVSFGGATLSAATGSFIARLTRDGGHVASRQLESFFVPRALDVDATGNVFIAGPFGDIVDFGGGEQFASAGAQDGLVAKLDPELDLAWAMQVGSIEYDNVFGVATATGGVFVGAYFSSEIELDGCGHLTSAGGADALLIKLDR